MSEKQTIDFDKNPPIATNDYDRMAKLALPGYEAMHQMAASLGASLLGGNLRAGAPLI